MLLTILKCFTMWPHDTNEDIKTNMTSQKMIMTMMMIAMMMTMQTWVTMMMTMPKEEEEESFFARSVYQKLLAHI